MVKRMIVVLVMGAVLASVPASASAALPAPRKVADACSKLPLDHVYTPQELATVRKTARCVLRRYRAARGLGSGDSLAVRRATRAALRTATRVNALTSKRARRAAVRKVRRAFERNYRPTPCDYFWSYEANDTGPRGTIGTPLKLARWLRSGVRRDRPVSLGRRGKVFVAARPGRILEGKTSGAVALLIGAARCQR